MFRHPTTALLSLALGEAAPGESEELGRHLAQCLRCQNEVAELRTTLGQVRQALPEPPPVDWSNYWLQLQRKLARRREVPAPRNFWQLGVTWTAVSAGVAAMLVLGIMGGRDQLTRPADNLTAMQQTVIGSQLDLLEHLPMIERLDLLEDFDVIQHLNEASTGSQNGANSQGAWSSQPDRRAGVRLCVMECGAGADARRGYAAESEVIHSSTGSDARTA